MVRSSPSVVEANQQVRHMVEGLIEDFAYDELGKHMKTSLEGVQIAGL